MSAYSEAPDWQRDLPCLAIAFAFHAMVLSSNPRLYWGGSARPADAPIPVEFVTEIPKPPDVTPQLAQVVPGGNGESEKPKGYGPGPLETEQIKKGLPDADPKAAPKPKVRRLSAAEKARIARLKAEKAERRRVAQDAALRRAEEVRLERAEARRRAAELAAQRAEAARVAREEARRRAAEAAERRAEAARQRAFQLAQARAERASRRAELERQLASLPNPDEDISMIMIGGGGGGGSGKKRPGAGTATAVAGVAGSAGAAAALEADLRDAVASPGGVSDGGGGLAGALVAGEEGDPGYAPDGRGGKDDANRRPAGGGFEDGGGGPVAWSVEGPVGNRRVLRRILPQCPDWVSQRGLELTVQLKFQVLDDGTVKRSIVIKRTSGFPDIDRLAIEALRQWKFQPIHAGVGMAQPDVWGVVSFKFLMG